MAESATNAVSGSRPLPTAVARRARSLAERPALVLTLIVLASAALISVFSLRVTSYEPDELGYTHLAIGIARSLTPFTRNYGGASRLNQLYPLLIAPLWGSFGNVLAFKLSHVWNAILMASSAIPTYLLARQVLRERWAAYGAAALVAVMPWAVIATAELTEVAAFPACTWALLAMQWCLARPSARRDVVALIAIGVAAYGRLQLIILVPVLVVAMIAHELGYEWHEQRRLGAAVKGALRRALRSHAVLSAIAVIGLVVGIPTLLDGSLASAFGFYGNALSGVAVGAPTFQLARTFAAGVALGVGGVPAVLAVGFVISGLASPRERRTHAFASLTLVVLVALLFEVAEVSVRFNGGVMQERYIFYVVPLIAVGMFACVLGTRRAAWAVVAGAAIVAAVVATTNYDTSRTPFWYQTSPGLTSFFGWIAPAFGASGSPTTNADVAALLPAGIVVGLLGVAVALCVQRRFAGRVLAGLAGLAVAFCCALTVHALVVVVDGNASGQGLGGGSLRNVDWVDAHVSGAGSVAQLLDNQGGSSTSAQLYNDNVFWNRAIGSSFAQHAFDWPVYLSIEHLGVDPSTGRIRLGAAASEPRDAVVARSGALATPVGRVLARSPGGSLELMRLAQPLRARDLVSGISSDGWLALDHPGRLRVWREDAGAGGCVRASLRFSLSPLVAADETLRIGGPVRRVTLRPGHPLTVARRLCPSARRPASVAFGVSEPADAGGLLLAPQLLDVRVTP